MKADRKFLNQPKDFWAHIRSISEGVGYTVRSQGTVKIPTIPEIVTALSNLGLKTDHIAQNAEPTEYGMLISSYFAHRAKVLNEYVRPRLILK